MSAQLQTEPAGSLIYQKIQFRKYLVIFMRIVMTLAQKTGNISNNTCSQIKFIANKRTKGSEWCNGWLHRRLWFLRESGREEAVKAF